MGNRKNRKDEPLLRDLIKDILPLIEEEEKKTLAPGGFELGTSRLHQLKTDDSFDTNIFGHSKIFILKFRSKNFVEFLKVH